MGIWGLVMGKCENCNGEAWTPWSWQGETHYMPCGVCNSSTDDNRTPGLVQSPEEGVAKEFVAIFLRYREALGAIAQHDHDDRCNYNDERCDECANRIAQKALKP